MKLHKMSPVLYVSANVIAGNGEFFVSMPNKTPVACHHETVEHTNRLKDIRQANILERKLLVEWIRNLCSHDPSHWHAGIGEDGTKNQ
jgi:hypothetical protein